MNIYPISAVEFAAPASEPITLAEAALHCRVDTDADDALINRLIVAAREIAEVETGRALITRTLDLRYTAWPTDNGAVFLDRPPVTSVTSVKYIDADGAEQTLDSGDYQTDLYQEPQRLSLAPSASWPSLESGRQNPITIRVVCGYASAAAIPSAIKEGMLLLVGHWYKNREDVVTGSVAKIPVGAMDLFHRHSVPWGY